MPDNPIQIADAALYLMKTQPSLGIKDPYELTHPVRCGDQPAEAAEAADQEVLGARLRRDLPVPERDVVLGACWPYQTNTLKAAKAPVKDLVPREGATGWLDTWMVASHTKDLECA